ncbi:MAG: type II toxin-antitoxin system HicA family toxin [Ignavibacteriae bacterium]|nr:type II toxin-antitoxin system HicA family toxin [Ignavibacteriota bacterium]
MDESIHTIINKLRSRKHNTRFRDARKLLLNLNFVERHSKHGTSHRVFSHPDLNWNITLVTHGRNDILPTYQVQDLIKALQELEELQQ